jgi:hypothetical protein
MIDDSRIFHKTSDKNCGCCGHLEMYTEYDCYTGDYPYLECNYHDCILWKSFDFTPATDIKTLPGNTVCKHWLGSDND